MAQAQAIRHWGSGSCRWNCRRQKIWGFTRWKPARKGTWSLHLAVMDHSSYRMKCEGSWLLLTGFAVMPAAWCLLCFSPIWRRRLYYNVTRWALNLRPHLLWSLGIWNFVPVAQHRTKKKEKKEVFRPFHQFLDITTNGDLLRMAIVPEGISWVLHSTDHKLNTFIDFMDISRHAHNRPTICAPAVCPTFSLHVPCRRRFVRDLLYKRGTRRPLPSLRKWLMQYWQVMGVI